MARSYTSRESSSLGDFTNALAALPQAKQEALRDSVFFTAKTAREAAIAGYGGPTAKNSFAWFTPMVEREVHARSVAWAEQFGDILGKIWDEAKKDKYPHGGAMIGVPSGLIAYDDRQTFIDRHKRFLASDYVNVFEFPLSKSLKAEFAKNHKGLGIREAGTTFLHSDKMKALVSEFNDMAEREKPKIEAEALDYLKQKVANA